MPEEPEDSADDEKANPLSWPDVSRSMINYGGTEGYPDFRPANGRNIGGAGGGSDSGIRWRKIVIIVGLLALLISGAAVAWWLPHP
jgi:hypothetical protein